MATPYWAIDTGDETPDYAAQESTPPNPEDLMRSSGMGYIPPSNAPTIQSDPFGSVIAQAGIRPPIPGTFGSDIQYFLREPGRLREQVGSAMVNIPEAGARAVGLAKGTENIISPEGIRQRPKDLAFQPGQSMIPGEPNAVKNLVTPGLATLATPAAPLAALSYLTDMAASIPDFWKEATDPGKTFEEKGRFITENLLPLALPVLGHNIAPEIISQFKRSVLENPKSVEPLTTGEPNASSFEKAATIHGDLQPQPIQGEGKMPAAESGGGIQPRQEPDQASNVPQNVDTKGASPEVTPAAQDIAKKVSSGERVTNQDTIDTGLKLKSVADLEALSKAQEGIKSQIEEMKSEKDPAKKMAMMNEVFKKNPQFLRETIEMATNTGSWVEGEGSNPKAYGERPLDWKKNPEVADWLRKNGERVGIALPEELKAAPKVESSNPPSINGLKFGGETDIGEGNKIWHFDREDGKGTFAVEAGSTPEQISAKSKETAKKFEPVNNDPEISSVALDPATGNPLSATDALVNKLETTSQQPSPTGLTGEAGKMIQREGNQVGERTAEPPAPTAGELMTYDLGSGEPPTVPPNTPAGEPLGAGANVTGLAERVRAEREAAGMTAPTVPGEGIAPEASVERGRQLLPNSDPEKIMSDFEATKKLSSDDVAIARAKTEQLARATNEAHDNFGPDSPEFKAAFKTESDWSARTKAMQTEWAKAGHAQQGEVAIDTGTFTGLARAFKEDTGKDFTPQQAETATKKAKAVKNADAEANTAKDNLYGKLTDSIDATAAEKRALKVASEVVRNAAVRLADAETKTRVADKVDAMKVAKIQEDAARKALKTAQEVSKNAAIKLADAENKARIKAAETPENVQEIATKKALDAANELSKKNAIKLADAENAKRIAKTVKDKSVADVQVKAAKKALDLANKVVREAAVKSAKAESANRVARADTAGYAWTKAKEYIDSGMDDFHDIVNKIATDMGISVDKVRTALAKNKQLKTLSDELFRKQQTARDVKAQAKLWLKGQAVPGYLRALQNIPKILFGLKVGFHGTVALGTHAPMVLFQPPFWATYIRDFAKMYKMVGSTAFHETEINDLVRRPNYTAARRAGLVNDPFTFEDFNNPTVVKFLKPFVGPGNRGYSVLKILRQDMFDEHWNKLPRTAQIPEMSKAIADAVNHATGAVKGRAPGGANLALFAPRLEASRVMWLAGDPMRAAKTFADWKNADIGEKQFAINQVKEKAWVAGTLYSLLLLNQGMLSATDSKQKVNLTDPMKSDFLKFKAAGMTGSYGNAMLSMARLPVRLIQIRESDGGKLKNLVHPDESTYTVLGEYARSQLSPFASLSADLLFKSDWQNRPLPNSNRPVPKRLAKEGVKPYTWKEFLTEQALMIPAEEAAREVWGKGFGMNPEQIKELLKMTSTIAVMGATGGRLVEDRSVAPEVPYWAK